MRPLTEAASPEGAGLRLARAIEDAAPSLLGEPRDAARLAALAAAERLDALGELASELRAAGRSGTWITEICLQCAIYVGPASLPGLLRAVGCDPGHAQGAYSPCPREDAAARDLMHRLHGPRAQAAHADPAKTATADLYARVAAVGYGSIWSRPGPEIACRLVAALAALAVTGPDTLMRKFWHAARAHGLTEAQLREAVMLTAVAQGAPRTFRALEALPHDGG